MPAAFTVAPSLPPVRRVCRSIPHAAAVTLTLLPLASCANHHSWPAAANASAPGVPAVATAARRIGVVRVIGNGQRFVLVEVPGSGSTPLPDGQLLRCASAPTDDAAPTAALRVARERRRPYVVADVVSGEPHVGDTVFMDRTSSSTAAAPVVLPTATSGVLPIVLPTSGPAPTPR